ncbi:hypothetical protein [Gynuella sunshinyii]|uniref:hypothetical protein n=1 Tax=Gynuella sunshinyii TaxID=1445505 RepID=UPI0005CC219E|nr:hypothetical protein [Gynuella sunshinyii]
MHQTAQYQPHNVFYILTNKSNGTEKNAKSVMFQQKQQDYCGEIIFSKMKENKISMMPFHQSENAAKIISSFAKKSLDRLYAN